VARLKILVVEDHAPFRRLTCEMLQRRPAVEIFEAADDWRAVRKAEAVQPDLILLDINLPEMHGFDGPRSRSPGSLPTQVCCSSPGVLAGYRGGSTPSGRPGFTFRRPPPRRICSRRIEAALAGRSFVSRSLDPRRHEILFCGE
jgi:DNA-binding NarL/FixJ family response regulator